MKIEKGILILGALMMALAACIIGYIVICNKFIVNNWTF